MTFIDEKKLKRLGARDYQVLPERAKRHAQMLVYAAVASRSRGTTGWERARLPVRPIVIYDLSGLPLFFDFPVRRGGRSLGFVRASANKALGDTVVSTQVNAVGWDLNAARTALQKLVRKKYRRCMVKRTRLVCYSYPKLALEAELKPARGNSIRVLMDVADFSEVPTESVAEASGQVAYSLLGGIPDRQEKRRGGTWDNVDTGLVQLIRKTRALDPARIQETRPAHRLEAIDRAFAHIEPVPPFTERVIDFCCHRGGCRDHECFCLHPQENSVHCTRASSQMVLCYWRYCYSQHDIAVAFNVGDNDLTPWSRVAPGLNSLTHGCFEANLDYSVTWSGCRTEIDNRRPFLSDDGGHTRTCAGYRQARFWIVGQPRPRWLYLFDPWPPNTGAITWENFNTTSYVWNGTLVRKTTSHT